MLVELSREEVQFLIVLLKVELCLSLRLLIPMILEGLFDHLMHFVLWHCAIAIANSLPLLLVESLHWYAVRCIHPHRDASHLSR